MTDHDNIDVSNDREIGESIGDYEFYVKVKKQLDAGTFDQWFDTFDPEDPSFTDDTYQDTPFSEGYIAAQKETVDILTSAVNAGEFDLWLEWQTPKTLDEWAEFDEKHGEDIRHRWDGGS